MANWYGTSRSNYFKVKDGAEFRAWADACNLGLFEEGSLFGIHAGQSEDGSWPGSRWSDDDKDFIEIDIVDELPNFLAEGQVAILMTAGAEKLRYVTGHATAVAWDGRITYVNLNDIYQKAADEFGLDINSITAAEY